MMAHDSAVWMTRCIADHHFSNLLCDCSTSTDSILDRAAHTHATMFLEMRTVCQNMGGSKAEDKQWKQSACHGMQYKRSSVLYSAEPLLLHEGFKRHSLAEYDQPMFGRSSMHE